MSASFADRLTRLSPAQLQLLALELQDRLTGLEAARHEPIAVIGMGCRFPGADGPAAYWDLLRNGVDAITEIPKRRWNADDFFDPDPNALGRMATRWGGFLQDVDGFDAEFFGVAPREAAGMDPQQRLLLEVAWEALENAGVAPDRLRGSATGVFVGICSSDYFQLNTARGFEAFDAYMASGGAHSVASGRLSYVLGLEGPAVSLDTACSSSLVAVHLAVRSLRSRECGAALAAGVNAILWPGASVALSRARMMAPDGRCKAFDHRADGFVRGEGCGVVVLKRLSDALADGDRVLALIRGTASNQDGRSNGLTAPNGRAQLAVVRDALADGGVEAGAVSYVEAHGTGTALGDPIELHALGAALSTGRNAGDRVMVGSVKTNIGHLEAAAGIAGLIKVILSLRERRIPASLHFERPNPLIDWDRIPLDVPTTLLPWQPPAGRPRVAGVSSFGFSGSNVHVIVEEPAPPRPVSDGDDRPLHILALSARNAPALRTLAGSYARAMAEEPGVRAADLCYTANAGRAHFEHRVAIVAGTTAELLKQVSALAAGNAETGMDEGQAAAGPSSTAFLFTGQGAQYTGMGSVLFRTEPVFREAMERCAAILDPVLPAPLLSVMYPESQADRRIHETQFTQPAVVALECALAELWRSWGIVPSAVMGHSLGEYAAACVAGVLSLEDVLLLVAERAQLMQHAPGQGGMAVLYTDERTTREGIAGFPRISIAALNGPENTVISGPRDDVNQAVPAFAAAGIEVRPLDISHAFHSCMTEPVLEAFETAARRVTFHAPRITLISNLTGGPAGDEIATTGYWRRHLREPVRFADGMASLWTAGVRQIVEIGPHPSLIAMARRFAPAGQGIEWLASLRRDRPDSDQVLDTLGALYVSGAPVDWRAFDRGRDRRTVTLPTYPFQRERFWLEGTAGTVSGLDAPAPEGLPGRQVDVAGGPIVFDGAASVVALPYLADHRVHGTVLAPAPLFVDVARAVGRLALGLRNPVVGDLRIAAPLRLADDERRTTQAQVHRDDSGGADVEIVSRQEDGSWTLHARCTIREADAVAADIVAQLEAAHARCRDDVDVAAHYDRLRAAGFSFGPAFRRLVTLASGEREAVGIVRVDSSPGDGPLHPAVLDGCLQVLGACLPGGNERGFLMVGAERVRCAPRPARYDHLRVHARIRADGEDADSMHADVLVAGPDGSFVAAFEGIRLAATPRGDALGLQLGDPADWLYQVAWEEKPVNAGRDVEVRGVGTALRQSAGLLDRQHAFERYRELLRRLEDVAALYVAGALRALGWNATPGTRVDCEEWCVATRVEPRYRRLAHRLFGIMADAGALELSGAAWIVRGPLPDGDPAHATADVIARLPEFTGEATLLATCGARLGGILTGRHNPLELLFPGGDSAAVEQLTQRSPAARAYNALVAEAVVRATADMDRPARIVEIGAGTGGTTVPVLEALARARREVTYVFSDVSPHFLARARERFEDQPQVQCTVLDVERDPASQGFEVGTADVVIAANVLHATRDLAESLTHARALLRPGGTLVLLEGTARKAWVDLTFGLTEGWWRFADSAVRCDYPLVSGDVWCGLLEASAWDQVTLVPEPGSGHLADPVVVLARASTTAVVARERWLVVSHGAPLGEELAKLVRAHGGEARVVAPGSDALRNALQAMKADHPPTRILQLAFVPPGAGETMPLEDRVELDCGTALDLAQQAIASSGAARLWIVTSGATPPGGSADAGGGALWGFGRTLANEHPEVFGGLVDLDAPATCGGAERLFLQVLDPRGDDSVALAAGRLVPRLARLRGARRSPVVQFRANATYVVTGALGGIGMEILGWLVARGARHLTILARRAANAGESRRLDELRAEGADIRLVDADVGSEPAIARALAAIRATMPTLAGVFHVAGIYDDAVLQRMDWPRFARVLAPKVTGAWSLHQLTRDDALDHFVLFGSGASLLGPVGLANYAAGNAFLDALAQHRRMLGLPAVCVDWGPWAGTGMAGAVSDIRRAQWTQAGFAAMTPAQALGLLETMLAADMPAQAAALPVDWRVFLASRPTLPPIFAAFRPAASPGGKARVAGPVLDPTALAGLDRAARCERLERFLRGEVARELGIREERLVATRPLNAMGLDSLMAVQLRNRVQELLQTTIPVSRFIEGPSIRDLASELADRLAAAPGVKENGRPGAVATTGLLGVQPLASADVAALSDDDVERLLRDLMEKDGTR